MSTVATPPREPTGARDEVSAAARYPEKAGPAFIALLLIALGLFFLATNLLGLGGSAFLLGLGLAFLVARVTTGRYGMAVPAGILLGLGVFTALTETAIVVVRQAGWSLIFLGLGFLAVYVIGWRPAMVWPVFPAAVLVVLGVFMLGSRLLSPLAPYAWVADFWPLALVIIGLWILGRDHLPSAARGILKTSGLVLLVLYGVFAFAAVVAAESADLGIGLGDVGFGGLGVMAPLQETVNLSAPVSPTDTVRIVNNTGGSTRVLPGEGSDVRVQATTNSWWRGWQPDIRLTPGQGGVTLQNGRNGLPLGPGSRIDYLVEVPRGIPVDIQSSSGDTTVNQLDGPVTAHTSSGSIRLASLSGDVRVGSSSGSIDGTDLMHVREATTSSGDVTLDGSFTDDARIQSSSGDVTVRLAPGSSVQLTAVTSSGAIRVSGLALTDLQQEQHSLIGTLGTGEGHLAIHTSSGDIRLGPSG